MTEVNIEPVSAGEPILELHELRPEAHSPSINLAAYDGEVIAITGLLGSGKSKLAEIIFGLQQANSGEMLLDGITYKPDNAADAVEHGVHFSPKDRSSNAVIPTFNIADNLALPFLKSFTRGGLLSCVKQRRAADKMIDQIGVVCPSANDGIDMLSGGNQQKVISRRLFR